MSAMIQLFSFICTGFLAFADVQAVETIAATIGPTFPDQYFTVYEYSLPYTSEIQGEEIVYLVQVYYDLPNNRLRVDYNEGVNKYLTVNDTSYAIFPVNDEMFCVKMNLTSDQAHKDISEAHYLPDVSKWNFTSLSFIFQPSTASFIRKYEYDYQIMDKLNHYTIYTTEDAVTPITTVMLGTSFIDGSHYDEYIQQFYEYSTYAIDDKNFDVPSECLNPNTSADISKLDGSSIMTRMRSMTAAPLPQAEHIARNKKFIDEYNLNNLGSHSLKLNRFAYWSDADFNAVMLPTQKLDLVEDSFLESPYHIDFLDFLDAVEFSIEDAEIFDEMDWRGMGPVGPVLDQSDCGSCWAFSAAQAMTSAWWMITNGYVGMSEQQIMDCAWTFGNYGCDGGWPWSAVQYVIEAGGIASTSDYWYQGINEECHDKSTPVSAQFSGYSMVPPRNVTMMKYAIQSFGPVAVCIDASPLSFRFHDQGIYSNPECGYEFEDLDHCVLAVGWGSENGTDYWIIKNSWSSYWGDEGYIKVSMEYDCGITTTPSIPIPDITYTPTPASPQLLKPQHPLSTVGGEKKVLRSRITGFETSERDVVQTIAEM